MADNTTLPGTGDVIADEDISGVKYQLIKLINPTAASTARWVGQTTKANSLPAVLPSDYQAPILPTNTTPTVTSVSANNADMVAAMDASNYRSAAVHLTGTWSATMQAQFSLDGGSNWVSIRACNINTGAVSTGMNAPGIYVFPVSPGAQVRLRTSSYTSGTITGSASFSSLPFEIFMATNNANGSITVAELGTGSLGSDGDGTNFSPSDGSGNLLRQVSRGFLYNGATWDRQRGVNALTLLASSARTTTTNGSDQTNYNWRGLILIVDVTNAGTGSITPSIQVKDSISGNYKTIWTAAAALTANGTYVYALSPGAASAASYTEAVQLLIGRTWRLQMVANNANSVTYSASADMQL